MLRITLESNQVNDALRNLQQQMPAVIAHALNKTAGQVKKELQAEMKRVFDKPTRWTLNSIFITPATPENQEVLVWLKDDSVGGSDGTPATKYLWPQVFGGQRRAKSFELKLRKAGILGGGQLAVPGDDAPLDTYGNITRGMYMQMTSGLKINADIGVQSNQTERSKRKNKKRAQYFVMGKERPLGIFRRKTGDSFESFLIFVDKINYTQRFDFRKIASDTVDKNLEKNAASALRYAIYRMRETGAN
jgi:hypothetical protein